MKRMFYSLQNALWSVEILVCMAAVVIGLIICAVRPYYAPEDAPDADTYVPVIENGIDGMSTGSDGSGEGVYVSAGLTIQLPEE